MSSKDDNEEMECGTSLAEDAWAVPSIADASTASSEGSGNKKSNATGDGDGSSIDDAWAKIHELRAKLAADVISDPPSSDNNNGSSGDNPFNFPTFISPYEQPQHAGKSKGTPHQTYKGMPIPLVYCDQTASQRPVKSIENYLREFSMPCHANTHTVS